MDFELRPMTWAEAAAAETEALILLWPDAGPAGQGGPLVAWVEQAVRDGDLGTEVGHWLLAHRLPGVQARRVVAVRCGEGHAASVGRAVASAWAALQQAAPRTLTLVLAQADEAAASAAVQSIAAASYRYTTTLSKPKPRVLQRVVLAVPQAGSGLQRAVEWAAATVHGQELAKEWANRPANHARPVDLAEAAQALAGPGLQVEVLGPKDVERLGMGALLAVARGSREPLRFIVLRYQGAAKRAAPVVLVGKGITFDTGGISLKPAAEMDEMKFDMSGAAAVLGVFAALAQLRPAINVVGLIPACENMPGGAAIKPGDVVTSLSGQTIEILNTDAEGRLILCDALTYAQRFKPRALIDVATLTGACVIALGHVRSGLFANDEALAQALLAAGEAAQDPCWRLPLDDDYAEALKSGFADVANVGGRPAGAVTAAKFLQRFVGQVPWAHLDIAGTAWKSGKDKGATGRPVPLLLRYLLEQAGEAEPEQRGRPRRKGQA